MTTKKWTALGVIMTIVSFCAYLFFTLYQASLPTASEVNTASNSGINNGIIAGKIEIGNQAKFNLVGREIQKDKAVFVVNADSGDLPGSVCVSISTDAVISDVRASFSGLKEGDRQTKICFTNPPRDFTLTYRLSSPSTFFNIEID